MVGRSDSEAEKNINTINTVAKISSPGGPSNGLCWEPARITTWQNDLPDIFGQENVEKSSNPCKRSIHHWERRDEFLVKAQ